MYAELEITARDPERVQFLQKARSDATRIIVTTIARQKAIQATRENDLSLEVENVSAAIGEEKLKKVIEELIDNAFKYSKAGSVVKITVNEQVDRFWFSITDYGRGMSADQIANLGAYTQFERKVYEQQGSGLGLSIAKRLIELHGGHFKVESTLNTSTTVHFTLPK